MAFAILDQPVSALEQAISSFSLGELEELLAAELNGKTRKGAVALLQAAIAAIEEPLADESPNIVENILPGTILSLGDGRSIAFGEMAEVSPDLAEFLRGRGQVK